MHTLTYREPYTPSIRGATHPLGRERAILQTKNVTRVRNFKHVFP